MIVLRSPDHSEYVRVANQGGYFGWTLEAVDVPPPGIDDIWGGTGWVFSPAREAERLAREDAASGGGDGGNAGQVILTVPNNSIQASATLAAAGVTGSSVVLIGVAPHTDADENTAEMIDLAAVSATPGTGTITVAASFMTPHAGPIRFNWSAF